MRGSSIADHNQSNSATGVALRSASKSHEERKRPRAHNAAKESTINYRRLQVTLSDSGFERLEAIRLAMKAPSQADVVREALSLLESVVEEVTAGKRLEFVDPKDTSFRIQSAFRLKIS
jgi:hypothetical protein